MENIYILINLWADLLFLFFFAQNPISWKFNLLDVEYHSSNLVACNIQFEEEMMSTDSANINLHCRTILEFNTVWSFLIAAYRQKLFERCHFSKNVNMS